MTRHAKEFSLLAGAPLQGVARHGFVPRNLAWRIWTWAVFMFAFLVPGLTSARAQEGLLVVVNGLPITTFDIPQRQRLMQFTTRRAVSRQEALDDLINDRVRFSEARRFRVGATEQQVDQAYAQVASRSGIAVASFDQVLRAAGIEPRVYRGKLRADLSWSNLIQARYGRTIFVTDSQLVEAVQRRAGNTTTRPVEYTFRQVLLVLPANAPAAVVQRRSAEANALRGRFTNCQTGAEQVRSLADAAIRDPIRRNSSDLSEEFRRVLDQTGVGRLTPPSRSQQGLEMIAVCARNELRTDDTAVRNQVRDEITTAEMQRISRQYLQRIRQQAVIEYKQGAAATR